MKSLITGMLLLAVTIPAGAQFYNFGTDPSRVRWSQIRTPDFKIVYPRGMDSLARVYLFNLEKMRPVVNSQLMLQTKRIPVILHPYTTLSNGAVSWAPKAVNLITTPEAYRGTMEPWVEQLANHELRHVTQTEHFTKGLFNVLQFVLGEQAVGVGLGILSSSMIMEGDAVLSETENSSSGRGRSASFLMYPRALLLDGLEWNWDRSVFGSYHYKTINKYALGYMMLATQRLETDDWRFTGKMFHDKAHLYDVSRVFVKDDKRSVPSQKMLIKDYQKLFGDIWRQELEALGETTPYTRISAPQRLYCDYKSPVPVYDSLSRFSPSVIAIKSGMEHVPELVRIDTLGVEHHVGWFSSYASKLTEAVGGRIYWSETVMHEASSLENFSEVRYMDLHTGKYHSLVEGTRWFNPSVHPDGSVLAVAEYPVEGGSKLLIVSTGNGDVLEEIAAPFGGQLLESCFSGDYIYVTSIGASGVGIYRRPVTGDASLPWEQVADEQRSEIRNLRRCGNGIVFSTDLDGVMNIYSIDAADLTLHKLTNSKYGASYPFLGENSRLLAYSEFDRFGYHLAFVGEDDLEWSMAEFSEPYFHRVAEALSDQVYEAGLAFPAGDSTLFDAEAYPAKNYSRLLNAFHIHSYAPLYYNVDNIMAMSMDHYYDLAALGATVYSQNELGTLTSMLGYSYHGGFHAAHAKATAVLHDFDIVFQADFNDRKQTVTMPVEALGNPEYEPNVTSVPYFKGSLELYYPFSLYHSGWNSMLIPDVKFNFSNDLLKFDAGDSFKSVYKSDLTLGGRYYRMLSTASATLFPRHGGSISVYAKLPVTAWDYYSPVAFASGYLYFPGFMRAHGIKLSGVVQHQFHADGNKLLSTSIAELPRGYKVLKPSADYAKLMFDYAMPVWTGDLCIPGILYLMRMQLIPFADVAYDRTPDGKEAFYGSVGLDTMFNLHLFHLGPEFKVGLRYARLLTPDGPTGSRNFFGPLIGLGL